MSKEILEILVRYMKYVGNMSDMSGESKKKYVLKKMRDELDLEPVLEDLIIHIIDLIIQVENGKLTINKKISKPLISCCFSSRK